MIRHLYDEIAKRWYRGGTVWFYSDTHFGDADMNARRNITDEEQVKLINSKLGKKDTIVFLGDIGDVSYIKKIRGYKVLIKGNHEKGITNYRDYFDEVYEGFLTISDKIILSHAPFMNLPEYAFNIHGHVHFQKKSIAYEYRYRYLNVCGDNIDYTPISINQIIESGLLKETRNVHKMTIEASRKWKR